ncbi:MAG: hypothetical protein ACLGQW_10065 [Acidobacteriota bacterium]
MRQEWGFTSPPSEDARLPLLDKVHQLILQDEAMARGSRMGTFPERQAALGLRPSPKLRRPPEVNVGKLMDIGS